MEGNAANVTTVAEAREAQNAGADAIVAQGMEAGSWRALSRQEPLLSIVARSLSTGFLIADVESRPRGLVPRARSEQESIVPDKSRNRTSAWIAERFGSPPGKTEGQSPHLAY